MDEVPGSIARRLAEPPQHFIPRGAKRLTDAPKHVDSGIRRSRLNALHVAPVDFRQSRQVVLSQSALRSQAVDVFSENSARRLPHSFTVRQRLDSESGLIVAFRACEGRLFPA